MMQQHKKRNIFRYSAWALAIVLLTVSLGFGGTMAYLKLSGGSTDNTFTAASSSAPQITEKFDQQEKTNVQVHVGDTGYSVYVRAAVVVTWKDASGNVLAERPSLAKGEYSIDWNLTDWFLGDDGFYYYRKPVESNASTDILIKNCKPLKPAPKEGFTLDVVIAAQTIQAAGTTDNGEIPAVTDAWGVSLDEDGTIIAAPAGK